MKIVKDSLLSLLVFDLSPSLVTALPGQDSRDPTNNSFSLKH
jgi:hypothetical protein